MQYPLKETYVHSTGKRKVRDFLLSFFNLSTIKTVVGLAGPDINERMIRSLRRNNCQI
jgi:hypothetical protein